MTNQPPNIPERGERVVSKKSPKLKTDEILTIRDLNKQNYKTEAIAELIGCHQRTVQNVILRYTTNTTGLAKRTLEHGALRMAKHVVSEGRPGDHVQVLRGMKTPDGVRVIEADRTADSEGHK